MEETIKRIGEFYKTGRHAEAASLLKSVVEGSEEVLFRDSFRTIGSLSLEETSVYSHFTALQIICIALSTKTDYAAINARSIIGELLNYVGRIHGSVLATFAKPVLTEASLCLAILFKLLCARGGEFYEEGIPQALEVLSSFTAAASDGWQFYVSNLLTKRVMEEFGVFDQQAKRRGIPLKIHRLCRAAIEKNDIIPHFITGLIRQIVSPPSAEGSPSLESALSCLRSLLSWPAHRFFEEDDVNADEFELWRVSGTNWANVLSVEISGGRYPLVEFFYQCSQHSKPELRNEYVELMVLAASYTSADWDSETASFYAQRSLAILLEVLSTHLNPDTFDERRLSLLTSGCQRWFCAYADDLSTKLGQPTWMSLLDYFSDVTSRLMSIECVSNDNECLMSSLDAVLNCWFQLSLTAGQSTQRHPGVGDKYVGLFKHFVDCKLAHMTSDENINDFSASFADSHLQFVAKMGRESCVASCQFLAEKTSQLMLGWQSQSIPPFVAYEGLWTVFKLCSLFIADPADGEEPSVPGCFLALGDDAGALMLLINMLVSAQEPLLSLSDSPSVCGAYAEIFEKFIVTYSECAVPQYTAVFDDDTLLVFALHLVTQLLQKFAFEDEVDTVVSHLLRCLSTTRRARSSVGLRNAADTKVLMELSSSMQFNCSSVVRGRLYAYLLTHFASTSTLTLDQVAETFPVLHARRSSSLQNVLESLHVITGLFSSLTDAPLLQTLLPIFTDASEFASIYCVGHSTERQAALSLLEMQNASFLTWSGALEGGGILQVIRSCCTTVTSTLKVYASDRGWYTDEGESDRNSFLISISGLIGTLCKWKTLSCFFPDEDVVFLGEVVTVAAGTVCESLNADCLNTPDVVEAVFECLELSASTFPSYFVQSEKSSVFLNAMTYALGQDNIVVQRAGISTCASVIDFLKTTSDVGGRTDFEVEVLKSILRVVVQNGVPSANCGHIAGSLVSVCRDIADVNHGRIGASFQNLSESFPLRKKGLLHVYHHLWKAVNGDGRETMNDFEECLLDSFTETVAL